MVGLEDNVLAHFESWRALELLSKAVAPKEKPPELKHGAVKAM